MKTPFQLLLFFVLLSASPAALHSQAIWRVHPGGDDENSGATWAESFRSLQRAIDAAVAGDTIWVAAGTYLPSCTESGGFRTVASRGLYADTPRTGSRSNTPDI